MFPVGIFVGIINSVAGGGMILAFPVMLALGYSPYVANVTNTIGVLPSNLGGVFSYMSVLRQDQQTLWRLVACGSVGSAIGAGVLLLTPPELFEDVVPFLIGGATLLLFLQPYVGRRLSAPASDALVADDHLRVRHPKALYVGVVLASVYGSYFGATTGVILLAVMGATTAEALRRLNGMKNAVALAINCIGVAIFAALAPVAWRAGLAQAAGALLGGVIGGRIAQRLPENVFRALVMAIGIFATLYTALG